MKADIIIFKGNVYVVYEDAENQVSTIPLERLMGWVESIRAMLPPDKTVSWMDATVKPGLVLDILLGLIEA